MLFYKCRIPELESHKKTSKRFLSHFILKKQWEEVEQV